MPDESSDDKKKGVGEAAEALIQRVSVVVSTITAISTLLISISSDALSTSQLLWVATGLCAACFGLLFLRNRPLQTSANRRQFGIALLLTCSTLAAAWAFAFRDEIKFSRMLTSFSSAPSVSIEPAISRALLMAKAGGATQQRLASFVDDVVPWAHQTRIAATGEDLGPNRGLSISGVVTDSKISLDFAVFRAAAPTPTAFVPTKLADLLQKLDSPKVLLQNAFDDGTSTFRVTAPPERAPEMLRAAILLASSLRVADSKDPTIKAYLEGFVELLHLFTGDGGDRCWMLEGILYVAECYASGGDSKRALSAVQLGLTAFPDEPRLEVAAAYLGLANVRSSAFGQLPSGAPSEVPVANVYRGLLAVKRGALWDASALFEAAANNLDSGEKPQIFTLRAAAALLAAMTRGNPDRRGTRIVTNAEKARVFSSDVRLVELLNAFGMALRGRLAASNDSFEALNSSAASDAERASLKYWRAQALAQTGKDDQARSMLAQTAEYGTTDAATLGLLAELMYDKATDQQGTTAALKVASKALDKDRDDPKGNRLMGLDKARQAERLDASQRRELKQEALIHLEKCIANGGGDAEIYSEMSVIYRDLAKAIPARESRRKALDLMCSLDGSPIACSVVNIRDLLESATPQKTGEAAMRTNELLQWLMDNPAAVRPFARDNMLIEAAIVWYENGGVNQSQLLYENVKDNLGHYESTPERSALASQVTCNLGFIYVDKGMTTEAVEAFRTSLNYNTSPDCQAGLAIALMQAHRDADALIQYRHAKAQDSTYEGEIEVLKKNNFWSDVACSYLQELVKADRSAAIE